MSIEMGAKLYNRVCFNANRKPLVTTAGEYWGVYKINYPHLSYVKFILGFVIQSTIVVYIHKYNALRFN